jgi:hypothetical protein
MNLTKNLFNKLKKSQVSAWLIIITGFLLTSCKANYQPTHAKISVDKQGWQVYDPALVEQLVIEKQKKQPKNVIVLFHGLDSHDNEEMREFAQKLNSDFSDALVINLNRYNSSSRTINNQAEETYQALKKELWKYNVKEHSIPNVILIGDSQGGVLALEVFRAYKQRCIENTKAPSKDHLKIKIVGIITHHSPLEGVTLIRDNTLNGLTTALNNPLTCLTITNIANISFLSSTATFLSTAGDQLANYANAAGVQDLDSHSTCITYVRSTLEKATIPILAIGGTVAPMEGIHALVLKKTSNNSAVTTNDLNATASTVKLIRIDIPGQVNHMITGSSVGEHDGLIPLSSQLAANIKARNLKRICLPGPQHHWAPITSPETYTPICKHIQSCFRQ